MIKHEYHLASDNIAQWTADNLRRQEVTPEFAEKNLTDCIIYIYVGGEDFGLDPWRVTYDWQYRYKPGMRLFVDRHQLRARGFDAGQPGGFIQIPKTTPGANVTGF